MQIVATFNNFEELTEFARAISGISSDAVAPVPAVQQPVPPAPAVQQTPVQQTPVAPVQQTPVAPVAPAPVTPVAPVAPVQQTPAASSVPVGAHDYSLDEISVAAMQLMDTGRQSELQQLLAGFGVPSLPALPKAQYGAFATQLRAMGARI